MPETVLLAARVVPRVIATLQAGLPDALQDVAAYYSSEFADPVTLVAPETQHYYNRPKAEISGGESHIEVFEGDIEFANPFSDAACGRIGSDIPITVRMTMFSREGLGAAVMMTRMRLAGAAIIRVFALSYTLQPAADDSITIAQARQYAPMWIREGENAQKSLKFQVPVGLLIKTMENNL